MALIGNISAASATNHPFDSVFNYGISGNGSGTFSHFITTIPAGKALVIIQVRGNTITMNNITNGSATYFFDPAVASFTFNQPLIFTGSVNLNFTINGNYNYNIMGYYVSLNS